MAGLLAAALALGITELGAGLLPPVPSLVEAVGTGVIDLAPPGLKDWAVAVFGTADKPVLLAGIVLVCALLGAAVGLLAARSAALGTSAFLLFGLVGVVAGAAQGQLLGATAGAAIGVAAGSGALRRLLERGRPVAGAPSGATPPADPDAGAPADPDEGSEALPAVSPEALSRRRFLHGVAVVAVAAAVSGSAGRVLLQRAVGTIDPATLVLPAPAVARPDVPAGAALDVDGISPLFTPNDDFYRIDTAFAIPRIDPAAWTLRVTGLVDREVVLTYDDLLAMPLVEADITIACVSNEVGGSLVGNARWLGVPLREVLDLAGPALHATQVVGRSVDGFTAGFRTEFARDGREALVAVGMNGEALPPKHGFPARLVVPGLFGYTSATKWLAELELTTWEGFDAYWVPRGWDKQARVLLQSRFDTPSTASTRPRGAVELAGVAWEPEHGISAVEIAVDDGDWRPAELGAEVAPSVWRHWRYVWQADEPGHHTLKVRAYDGAGRRQTNTVFPPRPFGATGHHTIRVTIA